MKKEYTAPAITLFSFVAPLTPLCGSRTFDIGSSSETSGGTTTSIWSNKQQQPNQSGIWSHMDD